MADLSGIEAAQGTVFHEYAASALEFGLEPHSFPVGVWHEVDGFLIEFDEEMVASMYAGLDWAREHAAVPGSLMFVEQRVNIEPWTGEPGGFGTTDVFIVQPALRRMIVKDWKYGKGIPVSPVENDQEGLYGLGSWESIAKDIFKGDPSNIEVVFHIEQPRAPGGGGTWTTTMKKLLKWGESIRMDADANREPNAPRTPGLHCEFCKARFECLELAHYALELVGLEPEDIDEWTELGFAPMLPDSGKFSKVRRSEVLLHKKMFQRWFDSLHASVLTDAKNGIPVPLLKVVEGRMPKRKFRESEEKALVLAAKPLLGGEPPYEIKLMSPAVVEKKVGKAVFAESLKRFVEEEHPKPTLVPLSDARPPMEPTAVKFDAIDLDPEDEDEE